MSAAASTNRRASIERATRETRISVTVVLDGSGSAKIATGLGFLDHMLTALACHSGIDLSLSCTGDLHVDDHHTVEDCAIAMGNALDAALGARDAVRRFGSAYAPLDEALSRAVIDLVTRPHASIELGLVRERLGEVSCENITHFFVSLAMAMRCTLHVDVLKGHNDHHRAESAFKALALALREAIAPSARLVSTKGVL